MKDNEKMIITFTRTQEFHIELDKSFFDKVVMKNVGTGELLGDGFYNMLANGKVEDAKVTILQESLTDINSSLVDSDLKKRGTECQ